ncbi:hypothetical protein D3C87_1073970 [compost metagenome]
MRPVEAIARHEVHLRVELVLLRNREVVEPERARAVRKRVIPPVTQVRVDPVRVAGRQGRNRRELRARVPRRVKPLLQPRSPEVQLRVAGKPDLPRDRRNLAMDPVDRGRGEGQARVVLPRFEVAAHPGRKRQGLELLEDAAAGELDFGKLLQTSQALVLLLEARARRRREVIALGEGAAQGSPVGALREIERLVQGLAQAIGALVVGPVGVAVELQLRRDPLRHRQVVGLGDRPRRRRPDRARQLPLLLVVLVQAEVDRRAAPVPVDLRQVLGGLVGAEAPLVAEVPAQAVRRAPAVVVDPHEPRRVVVTVALGRVAPQGFAQEGRPQPLHVVNVVVLEPGIRDEVRAEPPLLVTQAEDMILEVARSARIQPVHLPGVLELVQGLVDSRTGIAGVVVLRHVIRDVREDQAVERQRAQRVGNRRPDVIHADRRPQGHEGRAGEAEGRGQRVTRKLEEVRVDVPGVVGVDLVRPRGSDERPFQVVAADLEAGLPPAQRNVEPRQPEDPPSGDVGLQVPSLHVVVGIVLHPLGAAVVVGNPLELDPVAGREVGVFDLEALLLEGD